MLLGTTFTFNIIHVIANIRNQYTVPSKSSWTICKIDKSRYPQNSILSMQNKQFSAKSVGPDLDPYCLKTSFEINIFLEIIRFLFYFVQNLLEGIVYLYYHIGDNSEVVRT